MTLPTAIVWLVLLIGMMLVDSMSPRWSYWWLKETLIWLSIGLGLFVSVLMILDLLIGR